MNVTRTYKQSGEVETLSMSAATVVLAKVFNLPRAVVEQKLISGETIETHWYEYYIESNTKGESIAQ